MNDVLIKNEHQNNKNNNENNNENLFDLIKELATKGIDNLLQTYKQTDNPALLHTLNIYKNLLNNPEQQYPIEQNNQYNENNSNIDSVFINIIKLYSDQDLIIIFNTLQLIIKNPTNYLDYTNGLNQILDPINKQIQKWIVDNIVF